MTNQSPYSQQSTPPSSTSAGKAKKPLYKRWWVWLIVILLVLTIAGLFIDDDFSSDEEKQQAWEAYKCKYYSELSARPEGTKLSMEVMRDEIPVSERAEAMRWSKKLVKAGNSKTIGDVIDREDTPTSHDMCSGWLWEHKKEEPGFWDNYDNFTLENARNEGVVS